MESAEFQRHGRDGVEKLVMRLNETIRQAQEMRNNLLKQAGITVEPDRIRFGGNVAIEGTLSLPAGIIDNDALANPLRYDSGYANTVNDPTLTTSEQTFATFSIPVPAGFRRALVVSIAQVGVRNSSGASSAVASRIYVGPDGAQEWSARDFVSAAPGADVVSLATIFHAFNDLEGVPSIKVDLTIVADHTWPSAPGGGTVESFAIFTR